MTLRQSVAIAIVSDIAHVIVGGVLMLAGILGAAYQIEHPPVVKGIFYPTVGVAILGALILPSIFPTVQKIIVFIVPYLPLIGGKRAGDPPAPKP